MPADDRVTRKAVARTWPIHDSWRRWRRNTGNRPKTSILKSVNEKTCVVEVRREASTVDAMSAAFVDRDDGKGGARAASLTGARVELEAVAVIGVEAMVDLDFEGT